LASVVGAPAVPPDMVTAAVVPEAILMEPLAVTVPVPPARVCVEVALPETGLGPGENWARADDAKTIAARTAAPDKIRHERIREKA